MYSWNEGLKKNKVESDKASSVEDLLESVRYKRLALLSNSMEDFLDALSADLQGKEEDGERLAHRWITNAISSERQKCGAVTGADGAGSAQDVQVEQNIINLVVDFVLNSGRNLPGIIFASCRVLYKIGAYDICHPLIDKYQPPAPSPLWNKYIDGRQVLRMTRAGGEVPEYFKDVFEETDHYKDLFCEKPFKYFEVVPHGGVAICCLPQLNRQVGNIQNQTKSEIINSDVALEIRGSILDRSFRYCCRSVCPDIKLGRLPKRTEITDPDILKAIENNDPRVDRARDVFLSFDPTCNLSCPSCRASLRIETGLQRELRLKYTDDVILPLLQGAEYATMNGAGDIFTSRVCRHILEKVNPVDYPGLKFMFLTNGVLLTEKAWADLAHMNSMIRSVSISVDATKEETYNILRRGGNFKKLQENLLFLSRLRREGKLDYFQISLVYQAKNFREMKDFVKQGLSLGVDSIKFSPIGHWGSYETAEYMKQVLYPEHPDFAEFLEIIKDPIFKHPAVELPLSW